MKLKIKQGSTSQLARIFIQDSSATDGSGLTALVYNSSGLTWYWIQEGDASATQVTLATMTVGTWASGGFKEVDSTNMPGVYEIGIPDAAINAAGQVHMLLKGATNMAPVAIEIECDEIDYQNATVQVEANTVQLSGTTQTARDIGASVLLSPGTGTGQIELSSGRVDVGEWLGTAVTLSATTTKPEVDVNSISDDATAANNLESITELSRGVTVNSTGGTGGEDADDIVDLVWDEVLTGGTHNVTNSSGKRLRGVDDAFEVHSGTAQAGTANTITLDASASSTDEIYRGDRVVIVGGTGAQEHGIIVSYNGTTKVATMSENWVVTPDNTSEFELVPADVDIETWSHTAVSVSSTTTLPEVDAKSISDDATAADNVEANIGNLDASIATVDTVVDAIKAVTDLLPDAGALSSLATAANLATVDTVVDAIKAVTDDWADGGRLDLLLDRLITELDTATGEPGQGAPGVSEKRGTKIDYLYKLARNRVTQTATTRSHYADDGTTVDHKSTVSDDGTTYDRTELATGP